MPLQIEDMRISFLWGETVVDHFAAAEPFFLNRDYKYEDRFDSVRSGPADSQGLTVPWNQPAGNMFWTYYLEGKRPGDLPKRKAWKSLVPFRRRLKCSVSAPWFKGSLKIVPELYLYPHGQVIVLTFRCTEPLGLDDAMKTAHLFRRGTLELREGDAAPRAMKLPSVAETILKTSRAELFGRNINAARCSPTPFSVMTTIRGSGLNPNDPICANSQIHRALEAWTSWRPNYVTDALPDLSEARVKIRMAPVGHILYGRKRGRAIWFPSLFTLKGEHIRSLGCYHRNQLMAAIEVESLGELCRVAAERCRAGKGLTGTLSDCARRAGGALGRMFGGAPEHTYRSWSARVHIEQNYLKDVNEVRKYFTATELMA